MSLAQVSPAGGEFSRPRSRSSTVRLLTLAGSVLCVVYAGLFLLLQSRTLRESPSLIPDRWKLVFYPLKRLFPEAWLQARRGTELGQLNVWIYLGILAVLFGLYFLAVRHAFRSTSITQRDGPAALRRIVALAWVMLFVLMIAPATFSDDLFSYITYGRIYAVYDENPFTLVPAAFSAVDKANWLQWVYWKYTPSVYGPLWVLLAGGIAQGAQALGGDIVYHLLGHKLLAVLVHLLNIWLLWRVAGLFVERHWIKKPALTASAQSASTMAARVGVTLVYAWNPLVVIECGLSGHNDVLIVTSLLAAIWLHMVGKWRLAAVALAAGALVKAIVLLFFLGYLWLLLWERADTEAEAPLRSRIWRVAQAILLGAAAWFLAYLPFWEGPATLRPLVHNPPSQLFVHSLGALLRFRLPEAINNVAAAMDWQPPTAWTADAIGFRLHSPARWGPMLLFGAIALLQTWRARSFERLVLSWGWVSFAYLTVGAVWYWPWYATWLVPLAALTGPGHLLRATQLLCLGSMAMYAYYPGASPPIDWAGKWTGLLIVGPPLLYLLWACVQQLRGGRRIERGETPPPVPDFRRLPPAVRVPLQPERWVPSTAAGTPHPPGQLYLHEEEGYSRAAAHD